VAQRSRRALKGTCTATRGISRAAKAFDLTQRQKALEGDLSTRSIRVSARRQSGERRIKPSRLSGLKANAGLRRVCMLWHFQGRAQKHQGSASPIQCSSGILRSDRPSPWASLAASAAIRRRNHVSLSVWLLRPALVGPTTHDLDAPRIRARRLSRPPGDLSATAIRSSSQGPRSTQARRLPRPWRDLSASSIRAQRTSRPRQDLSARSIRSSGSQGPYQ
jgi:hypothetical protein